MWSYADAAIAAVPIDLTPGELKHESIIIQSINPRCLQIKRPRLSGRDLLFVRLLIILAIAINSVSAYALEMPISVFRACLVSTL